MSYEVPQTLASRDAAKPNTRTKINVMKTTVFTKALERLLRSVDDVIETHTHDDAPGVQARGYKASNLCQERLISLEEVWARSSASCSASQGDAAVAAALVRAQLEAKMFMRIEMMFLTVREQAAVAQSTPSAAAARCGHLRSVVRA